MSLHLNNNNYHCYKTAVSCFLRDCISSKKYFPWKLFTMRCMRIIQGHWAECKNIFAFLPKTLLTFLTRGSLVWVFPSWIHKSLLTALVNCPFRLDECHLFVRRCPFVRRVCEDNQNPQIALRGYLFRPIRGSRVKRGTLLSEISRQTKHGKFSSVSCDIRRPRREENITGSCREPCSDRNEEGRVRH